MVFQRFRFAHEFVNAICLVLKTFFFRDLLEIFGGKTSMESEKFVDAAGLEDLLRWTPIFDATDKKRSYSLKTFS